ncbi:MAG: DUF721 domain-containing protein [Fimbriimonadaceae bacterium]|nr:MAG: DUF721 domain-containing protein [Armatimonadota bacterium]MBV6490329.1 hypothetical protein [Fimbriimonadaceae bacterium]MCL4283563.1 DUF721 domain-containing protein [Fimbriimonadaceae bacterium]QOJ11311.1 MAG: DUF721 domain-containing protein [Chthonomonadaceae bacterium]GIK31511.1 MAG: hypothetical protein BroJett009_05030 [Armatimonadota bacterium]
MNKLREILAKDVVGPEVARTARALAIMRRWREVVGEELAARSWPDRYSKGSLWVAVQGSAWAQELRMLKTPILSKLNALAGEPLFVNVRFGVRALPLQEEAAAPSLPLVEDRPTKRSIREIREKWFGTPGDAQRD